MCTMCIYASNSKMTVGVNNVCIYASNSTMIVGVNNVYNVLVTVK